MRVFWNAVAWDEFIDWVYTDFEIAKVIIGLIDYLRQRGKLKVSRCACCPTAASPRAHRTTPSGCGT
jgi:hypothetical protein